jgi:ABC-type bacteriocin/lantibiotic exporter with double-glycine peptidase domain
VTVYLGVLLWQSPLLGGLTLAVGALQVLVLALSTRPIGTLARQELAAFGRSQGYLGEALVGIATLKAAGAEHRALVRWSHVFCDHLNVSLRYSYAAGSVAALLSALPWLGQLLLLCGGATQVLNGSMSLGTMVGLMTLAGAFFAPLASLVSSGQQFHLAGANYDRIRDVTEAEPEQTGEVLRATPRLTGRIRLDQVGFLYAQGAPEVLRGLHLTVRAGSRIAIVGVSGSGKSTLGKLLLGLYAPTGGRILYDDLSLQDLSLRGVRRQYGVVLQESTLFTGSIRSNIALSDPSMDLERVIEAARLAAVHDDIVAMPMGYDTFISEAGSALSGGQRQRLAIARAIAQRPTILLLDEATSHLDVETERRVAANLRRLACTQIIIAHRLSTVRDADMIVVLDQGAIVERGTHDELLRRDGHYARLARGQLGHGVPHRAPHSGAAAPRRPSWMDPPRSGFKQGRVW